MASFSLVVLFVLTFACFTGPVQGFDECSTYSCKNGAVPEAREDREPLVDGCGDLTRLVRDKTDDFTQCCNKHDVCYGTCGTNKVECDQEFKACANRLCSKSHNRKAECRASIGYYMVGLKMVGCPMFNDAQAAACRCEAASADDDEDFL